MRKPTTIAVAVLVALGCGGQKGSPTSGTGTGAAGATGGSGGSGNCGPGHVAGGDGSCIAVGIQGCAAMFVDADGLCRPSLAKCPAGTIPKIDQGCVPAGIQGCAKDFVGADGFCHPTTSKCAAGTYAVPQKGCVSIDGPNGCGAAPWGNIPDGAMNVYVDPTYAGGDGDGSKAKPVTTIAAALALVQAGGRIALAAGEYTEHVTPSAAIEVAGRCPSMVKVDGNDGDPNLPTVFFFQEGPSAVRGVTISGGGVGVYAAADVTIDTAVVDGTLFTGVAANGTVNLKMTSTLLQNTQPQDMQGGDGIALIGGATATIADSAIVGNADHGIFASDAGTSVTTTDVLVENSLPQPMDMGEGQGFGVVMGAKADLSATASVASHTTGLLITDAGTTVTATNILVEGTQPQASDMSSGGGLEVDTGASLTLTGSLVSNNYAMGVFVDGATATLSGNLIVDTQSEVSSGWFGRAVNAQDASKLTSSDNTFSKSHEIAVAATDPGTDMTSLRDIIEDTGPQALDGQYGIGAISAGGVLRLTSVSIARSRVAALVVSDGTAYAEESLFADTMAGSFTLLNPMMTFTGVGDGLVATRGSAVVVKGLRAEGCVRAGIVFDSSMGSVTAASATSSKFGLVLDGMPLPTVDKASSFAGNAQDQVNDANLPVPSGPAAVPK